MVLSTHQPIFMPWPGLFQKALRSDCLVLLDNVQFPRGRGWMHRNRLKQKSGELWISVPVRRRGRGLQTIREAEVCDEEAWGRKLLGSLRHWYSDAPYLGTYLGPLEELVGSNPLRLSQLNVAIVRLFWDALNLECQLLVQSEMGVTGTGSDLLINLCRSVGADAYSSFNQAAKYVDSPVFFYAGIDLRFFAYRPLRYPQLWGDFLPNLSTLDLLLNCGPTSRDILKRSLGSSG